MADMIAEFVAETRDGLNALDLDILLLEKNPHDADIINRIFRLAHTIKGGCGFLGLGELENAAHAAESLLSPYREGKSRITAQAVSGILSAFDLVRGLVDSLDQKPAQAPVTANSLRIDVDAIDALSDQIGELVLACNALHHAEKKYSEGGFQCALQQLGKITNTLQQGVIEARLQPLRRAWEKLPRLVRDMAAQSGKKIRLEMTGAETRVDRQILEMVRDPIMHMIRNAVAHGIENPDQRKIAGKPAEGTIGLSARYEGGYTVIDITDDGAGIDIDKVRLRALELKLGTSEELAHMPDSRLQEFVLAPGFSTAGDVTVLSGRGVGMDVVHENIQKIDGSIDVRSARGQGTIFTLTFPLTLTIIPVFMIEQSGARYAIPLRDILAIEKLSGKIDYIGPQAFLRRESAIIPLASLPMLLDSNEKMEYAVVIKNGMQVFALGIPRFSGQEEIVVKPLPPAIRNAGVFSGSAVLSDGGLCLILDLKFLSRGISPESYENSIGQPDCTEPAVPVSKYLVFKACDGHIYSVPLMSVLRLEELRADNTFATAQGRVFKYGDIFIHVLPWVDDTSDSCSRLIVLSHASRQFALTAAEIIDVVEVSGAPLLSAAKDAPWVAGRWLIEGAAAGMLNLGYFSGKLSADAEVEKKILLIDDSDFALEALSGLLRGNGYQVITAPDAAAALSLRAEGGNFNLIISDIEMPNITGLEFAKQVKSGASSWKNIPLLGLSAHARPYDRQAGLAAGFDDYLLKFDDSALLQAVAKMLRAEVEGRK